MGLKVQEELAATSGGYQLQASSEHQWSTAIVLQEGAGGCDGEAGVFYL